MRALLYSTLPMGNEAPREPPTRIGRYRMFSAFARGGMASVHLGRLTGPAGFSRLVALKLLHPAYAAEPEYYTMLLDEARLSSRIVHPNVVQTLDVVQEGDKLCIVMEYVHGVSLANAVTLLARRGERVPPPIAAAILVGVLHGLHAAHEARGEDGVALGIVHRDISPQNIVVGADGVARVLDFGVAKALRKEQVTREGHIKGKIAYMAPEQLTGTPVTRQADLRAAGIVLWEALVGRRLFEEDNEARLMMRVMTEEVPEPGGLVPGIDPALDRVVLRAVAFDKRARFATSQEMAEALAAAVPPATREEIAAWIQSLAADQLDARAQLVRSTEACDDPLDAPEGAAKESTADGTAVVTRVDVPVRRRPKLLRAALALALIATGAALALVRFTPGRPTVTAVAASAAPPAVASAETLTLQPVVMSADTPPVASDTTEVDPKLPTSRPRVRPAAHAAVAKGARAACDPPYSIDADGVKHYKPSCLQ